MHEISIVEALIGHIQKQRALHKFNKIISVEVICGKYNCASEDSLNFCFQAATQGTDLSKAKIRLKRLDEKYKCSTCHQEFTANDSQGKTCPICRSQDIFPIINNELYLNRLEVE